ncbi:helix-turn-helix domain-containing protein [Pelagerythrobacter marensis]|uniref:helix-turn-helix domain-containing protein n=1 Tax=Pelagerythrobacter marensis TaxID=543877 RepID=UPI003CC8642B
MRLRSTDQSELAREIGVTQGAISKIVLGKTANSRLLPRIASHLGVSLPWLLGESEHMEGDSEAPLSSAERDWVEAMRALDPDDRKAVLRLTRSLARRVRQSTLHDNRDAYRGEQDIGFGGPTKGA